jgi:hypothetical protein
MKRLEWIRHLALPLVVVGSLIPAHARLASAAESEVPSLLVEAVTEALAGWGEFASSGDLTTVEPWFAEGGPQHQQLEAESVAWTDEGGYEPLRFVVRELRLRRVGVETATVWARVEAIRPGFEPRVFSWDFDLVLRDGRWQVWTVVAAQPPDPAPPVTQVAPGTLTTSPSTTVASLSESPPGPRELAVSPVAEATSPPTGVRLPVLSAWIIVITIVGVALAGYLAPRIDRRGEG